MSNREKKAVVSLSGGVDSATCLGIAVDRLGHENVVTVSVNYGQKHDKELKCAEALSAYYDVKHHVIDLTDVLKFSNCSLLKDSTEKVPEGSYDEQIGREANGKVATYVPFRNGLMLSSLAAFAMSVFPECDVDIYIGAHADDAAGNAYADCSVAFVDAMSEAINIGTYEQATVQAPLVNMNKSEVVATGLKLGVPYEMTWSCYKGGEEACGKCGTCIDRIVAFEANGVKDPIRYKED